MRRRKVILSQQQDKTLAVDISPLLDVVFILLIFFIVSAVFVRETGIEVERPQAASATQVAERSVLIALTANGEVWHGGAQIGLAGVAPLLRQMTDKPVVIQADTAVEAGLLVSLIDACKLASSATVSVATKQG
ncbi:ExbD/TolR family protein [Shewanella algidipiscicola]|uniref:ExbD/TolR family protein n=1 Tax=Shewanella algidipiscicola TaxID=614070 RepID=UPI000D782F01|nr:biopolymer transporter ExbD [Shewanella algidipiscicola]